MKAYNSLLMVKTSENIVKSICHDGKRNICVVEFSAKCFEQFSFVLFSKRIFIIFVLWKSGMETVLFRTVPIYKSSHKKFFSLAIYWKPKQ